MNKDKASSIQKRIRFDWANNTCKDCGVFVGEFERVKGKRSLVLSFEGLSYDIGNQD